MISELKTFITVVELKNFTKAAQMLNMSQPSVSIHIKNLEAIFNTTLISRSVKQKKIVITESGYRLYARAKEMLDLIELTRYELTTESTALKGSIRIGASLTIGEYLLPEFLSFYTNKYPEVDIEVVMNNTSSICKGISDLSYDIGFIEGPPVHGNLIQHCFYEDQMVLAYPTSFSSPKEVHAFDNLRWITREDGSGTREYLNMYLSQNQVFPQKIMTIGSNYAIKEAVKAGIGVTIISKLVVAKACANQELSIQELDHRFSRQFSYLTPKNMVLSSVTKLFLDELEEFYKEYKIENRPLENAPRLVDT